MKVNTSLAGLIGMRLKLVDQRFRIALQAGAIQSLCSNTACR